MANAKTPAPNQDRSNIAGLRGTAALALSLCSRLASAPNIAGPALNRFALSLCSRLPRARSAIHPFT